MSSEVEDKMQSLISEGEAAGISVAAVKEGRIVFARSLGISRIEDGIEKPIEGDDKFRIASISKLVTTIGFMKLVEDKKISLDDDVRDYLDFDLRNPGFPETPITPRMLLSHTSSIRDADYYTAPMPCTMEDFFLPEGNYYEKGKHFAAGAGKEPGRYFTYCNLNFGLIASMIERISGRRFDIYMREEVFEPLGIQASYNVRDFGEDIDKVGVLYRKEDGVWKPQVDDYRGRLPETSWYTYAIGDHEKKEGDAAKADPGIEEYVSGSNGTLFSPHGGLRISARDLAKIMLMLTGRGEIEGKTFMKKKTIEEMERSCWEYDGSNGDTMDGFMCNYGMSVHHLRGEELRGRMAAVEGYMGHSGEAYGLLSGMFYDPHTRTGWVHYITGTGRPLDEVRGRDSAFTSWEEKIIEGIFTDIFDKN